MDDMLWYAELAYFFTGTLIAVTVGWVVLAYRKSRKTLHTLQRFHECSADES